MGAEGINLPCVKDAGEVRAALDAIHYPPLGHRSACGHTRAGGYNSRRSDFPEHVKRQHERVTLWCALEDPESLARVGEIAALQPGPDVISVGRGDLSAALGLHGQVNHPEVIAAAERVIAQVAQRSGGRTASSTMIERTEDIAPWLARGCRLFTYAADAILLMERRAPRSKIQGRERAPSISANSGSGLRRGPRRGGGRWGHWVAAEARLRRAGSRLLPYIVAAGLALTGLAILIGGFLRRGPAECRRSTLRPSC